MEKKEIARETARQAVHAILGVILIAFLVAFGKTATEAALVGTLLVGLLLINWKLLGSKIPIADWFHRSFERDTARFPGYGSAWYIVGALIVVLFLKTPTEAMAGILVLGVGDAASTLAGMTGRHSLPYNRKKTLEGSMAFFLVSLPAYFFIGWLAIPLALLGAIVESLPLPYDDNITIPVACVLFFALM